MARAAQKRRQQRNRRLALGVTVFLVLALVVRYLSSVSLPVLQTAGPVAAGEKRLLVTAFLLGLLVLVPVLTLTFGIVWRYREQNKATYTPNWDHSRLAETIWWLIPTALIAVIAVMTWRGTFALDPRKPLVSAHKPLHVQVVALQWRWLFIYPDLHVASMNELHLPVGTPVQFAITADAPMNSFWIPQLGGQIYAMPGMNTQLNLQADRPGTYYGSSANVSGAGFADMHFKAIASQPAQFDGWVAAAKRETALDKTLYDALAQPQTETTTAVYANPSSDLYSSIIGKYTHGMHMDGMDGMSDMSGMSGMEGMH